MALKLLSWNVNGIRAAEKKGFLDWLAASGADVVGVQETKASPDQLSAALLNPPGYVASWSSAEKKGYSGVATYSYYPNGGRGPDWVAYKLRFYTRFLEAVRELREQGREVVATGDFNTAFQEIDLARPKENSKTSGFLPEEREGLGHFFEAGFVDTFRHLHPERVAYSWWDMRSGARAKNLGWRIDYFLVTPGLLPALRGADVHEAQEGSDHCPVSIDLDLAFG
jgi:exodeoxyribonuclease-3